MLAGGATLSVDNQPININAKHLWKGAMIQDVPNACFVIGYTNASWTLGADATAQLVTRFLNKMEKHGQTSVVPQLDAANDMKDMPVLNLNSTYVLKAEGELPKAGSQKPWLPRSTYFTDMYEAKFGNITKCLKYT